MMYKLLMLLMLKRTLIIIILLAVSVNLFPVDLLTGDHQNVAEGQHHCIIVCSASAHVPILEEQHHVIPLEVTALLLPYNHSMYDEPYLLPFKRPPKISA